MLPEPLLTFELYDEFLESHSKGNIFFFIKIFIMIKKYQKNNKKQKNY